MHINTVRPYTTTDSSDTPRKKTGPQRNHHYLDKDMNYNLPLHARKAIINETNLRISERVNVAYHLIRHHSQIKLPNHYIL